MVERSNLTWYKHSNIHHFAMHHLVCQLVSSCLETVQREGTVIPLTRRGRAHGSWGMQLRQKEKITQFNIQNGEYITCCLVCAAVERKIDLTVYCFV